MELNNFHYAMFLANKLYGVNLTPDDFEEIGLIAWNKIGNKRTRIYKAVLPVNKDDNSVELPCNCDIIEAVTYGFEDWEHVSNLWPLGDYKSLFTEAYTEAKKIFRDPLYISGKYVKYQQVGNTLFLDRHYCDNINILYRGEVLDDDGLPQITNKEANAIAMFCLYITLFKQGMSTSNSSILQQSQIAEQKWLVQCDQARVPDYLSQNDMDKILDATSNWNRKVHGKSYKVIE